jgi:hypothetical protein
MTKLNFLINQMLKIFKDGTEKNYQLKKDTKNT